MSISARNVALVAVMVASATESCAVLPQNQPPAASPVRAPDAPSAICEEVTRRLVKGEWDAVRSLFAPKLRESVTEDRLANVWRQTVEKNGPIVSWRLVERKELSGFVRCMFGLSFERGEMIEVVSVDSGSNQVSGLFIRAAAAFSRTDSDPAALAGPEGSNGGVVTTPVTFGKAPFTISGVISAPAHQKSARLPAVLLIAGSGPQDRDETVRRVKPFRDLAEGLASRGIVSLRYDKRTESHPFIFDACRSTVEEEVIHDAVDAVGILRQLPYVDPTRIYLVGHSLGAFLVPDVASRATNIAGLIMIAPPGRPITEIVLDQLRRKGNPDISVLEKMRREFDELPGNTWWVGAPVSYWRDLENRDEFSVAKRLGLRTLLIRGDRDENVSEDDLNRWIRALDMDKRCVLRLPNVDHVMVSDNQRANVTRAVIDGIAQFVLSPPGHGRGCP